MPAYKCLIKQSVKIGVHHIEPIRFQDRYKIMNWRNEQIYHLRQSQPLSKDEQDHYFSKTINELFNEDNPNQILFSFLENSVCLGYGGLVNISWINKNAEISFIMKTDLEKEKFAYYWKKFLLLIEQVAFFDLNLHKIFTYAFDLRPHLYPILEECGFAEEVRLKEHCFFEGRYIDVVINSKINKNA
jgi:RimJ/RimL family protein N-acetyltransferase